MGEESLDTHGGGNVIAGYSMLARIGKGGMGSVFKAIQLSMNRLVALKILPIRLAKDRTYIRRFLREARNAAQLNHINITRVYDVGSYRGIYYFSMEYVDGVTLLSIIENSKADIRTAVDIILQAAYGLTHAHSHNIIHRDIKPENIMIATDGTVKITDLGLAKKLKMGKEEDITLTGQVIGTPCYMSPEQVIAPKEVDQRTDIYGLGVTFYHLLTGRRPFIAENSAQTLVKVISEYPPFPKDGKIPVQLVRLVKKMIAKEPSRRYHDSKEVIRELSYLKRTIFTPCKVPAGGMSYLPGAFRMGIASLQSPAVAVLETTSKIPLYLIAIFVVVISILLLGPRVSRSLNPALSEERSRVTSESPTAPTPDDYFEMGLQYARTEQFEKALVAFDKFLEVESDYSPALNNKGVALLSLSRFSDALALFDSAVAVNPNDPQLHINRGLTLHRLGRYSNAAAAFRDALALDPDNPTAALSLRKTLEKSE